MLKLPFYKQREKNILDGEIYTTVSLGVQKLKGTPGCEKGRGKTSHKGHENVLGRRLGKLENYIRKKEEADDIKMEQAISMLNALEKLEDCKLVTRS